MAKCCGNCINWETEAVPDLLERKPCSFLLELETGAVRKSYEEGCFCDLHRNKYLFALQNRNISSQKKYPQSDSLEE